MQGLILPCFSSSPVPRLPYLPRSIFAQRLHAGLHAKSVMVQANYRLVVAICKKYQDRGMSLQDLVAEGIRGLLTGVERFDADKGFRFSTYAHWWIRQAVTRSLTNQAREVRWVRTACGGCQVR